MAKPTKAGIARCLRDALYEKFGAGDKSRCHWNRRGFDLMSVVEDKDKKGSFWIEIDDEYFLVTIKKPRTQRP